MTLQDIMKPNKFGTMPMLHFTFVGTAKLVGEFVEVKLRNMEINEYLPLDTEVVVSGNDTITIRYPMLDGYTVRLVHWLPLTPDQFLIHQAIEPIKEVCIETNVCTAWRKATESLLAGILDDGTGWIDMGYGLEPATFYIEDILYRLDLQGKLT